MCQFVLSPMASTRKLMIGPMIVHQRLGAHEADDASTDKGHEDVTSNEMSLPVPERVQDAEVALAWTRDISSLSCSSESSDLQTSPQTFPKIVWDMPPPPPPRPPQTVRGILPTPPPPPPPTLKALSSPRSVMPQVIVRLPTFASLLACGSCL
jgi:hypothetical protein